MPAQVSQSPGLIGRGRRRGRPADGTRVAEHRGTAVGHTDLFELIRQIRSDGPRDGGRPVRVAVEARPSHPTAQVSDVVELPDGSAEVRVNRPTILNDGSLPPPIARVVIEAAARGRTGPLDLINVLQQAVTDAAFDGWLLARPVLEAGLDGGAVPGGKLTRALLALAGLPAGVVGSVPAETVARFARLFAAAHRPPAALEWMLREAFHLPVRVNPCAGDRPGTTELVVGPVQHADLGAWLPPDGASLRPFLALARLYAGPTESLRVRLQIDTRGLPEARVDHARAGLAWAGPTDGLPFVELPLDERQCAAVADSETSGDAP